MEQFTETIVYSFDELDTVAKRVQELFLHCNIFALSGLLGAGKTSLVQAILRRCGVMQPVVSPTFTYVQSYEIGDVQYHHFDLYRITSIEGFCDLGFDEYFNNSKSIIFVEWPEIVNELLTKDVCSITIDYQDLNVRRAILEWAQEETYKNNMVKKGP